MSQRAGNLTVWPDGKIVAIKVYLNPDEGRAAAERVAHERADG